MLIKIPFEEDMAKAIKAGRKTCTTRTKRYGNVGDIFRVENGTYGRFEVLIITDVKHITLHQVATYYYKAEGFDTPEGFINKWRQLHPRAGWLPNQRVWTYFFKKD